MSGKVLLLILCLGCAVGRAQAEERAQKAQANHVAEWAFVSTRAYADPFNDVTLDVVFTAPDGGRQRVPAFWAGGKTWRVRYASSVPGTYRFRTECGDAANPGLNGVSGTLTVTPYRGDNPLYRHGPVRVAADHRHFEHADGTPFLWLGDTWWMGLSSRLHWPDEFQTLTADRKAKGFNVIQIVAGLYPEMPVLDPRGVNEAGLPWKTDFTSIRPEYFDAADRRMDYLIEAGLTPCVVGAWGYFQPTMGTEHLKQHWRYLIARYGAYPVIWCAAGEVNLPYYKLPGFPYEDAPQVKAWTEICRSIRQTDPFHRVLTVHPTGLGRLTARGATEDPTVLDYDMLQTGHGGMGSLAPTLDTIHASYTATPRMPVVDGEVNYEQLLGPDYNPPALQRLFVWSGFLSGLAGYTYGGNGIWQVNRAGEQQVTFGNYPTPNWDQAMRMPGSAQVGLARKLLLSLPWQHFEPHPEWATLPTEPPMTLSEANWIWFPEGNPAEDAPVEKRYMRLKFLIPEGATVVKARLKVSADDACTAYVNGHELGACTDRLAGRVFTGLERILKPGPNAVAVMAQNLPAPVTKNPAGLIAKLELRFADGTSKTLVSDPSWRASRVEAEGWRTAAFDDARWVPAMALASYGLGPWGKVSDATGGTLPPYCAGIPGKTRVVYLPQGVPVTLRQLEPGQAYAATWIDPITGQRSTAGTAHGNATGDWISPAPPGAGQDWLLLLNAH